MSDADSNVINFRTEEPAGKPVAGVIAALEDALSAARSGGIQSVVIVGVTDALVFRTWREGIMNSVMVGGLERAKFRIVRDLEPED